MSLRVYYEVLNQRGTPALFTDTLANRPAFGFQGRLFISTDSGQIFEDTGTAWILVADAGVGGGTLSSVCLNGNTTATGIVITAGGLTANAIIKSGGTAAQFLKADGSVDSNTYLTTSAASTTYVPYTGATANVNLGSFELNAILVKAITLEAKLNGTASGNLTLRTGTNGYGFGNDAFSLASSPDYDNTLLLISNKSGVTKTALININSLTADRTFTLPNATGTLALTSDLSGYLPLTGGTLTGGLNGTTGTFSGIVTTPQVKASTSAGLSINANSGTQVADFGAGGSANITFFGGLSGTSASFSSTVTGSSLIKSGGTAAQILAADGSVITAGTNITISGGTISSSGGGGGMAIGGSITSATAGSVLFAGASGVLAQNNANFFWDNTNSRLGIGTATPTNTLSVTYNNNTYQRGLIVRNNNTGTNAITGIQLVDSSGVSRGNFDFTPSNFIPSTLAGSIFFSSESQNKLAFIANASSNGAVAQDIYFSTLGSNTTYQMLITGSSGFVSINTNTAGSRLQVNGNAAIGYSASTAAPTNGLAVSGSVGIGTISPDSKLVVSGSGQITSKVISSDNQANVFLQGTFGQLENLVGDFFITNNAASSPIIFRAGSATERMRITSGGNVLINSPTDNGQGALQVTGGITANDISLTGATYSSSATITSNYYSIFTGASGQTLTLPTPLSNNYQYVIINNTANTVTLAAATSCNIVTTTGTSVASITLIANQRVFVIADGNNKYYQIF